FSSAGQFTITSSWAKSSMTRLQPGSSCRRAQPHTRCPRTRRLPEKLARNRWFDAFPSDLQPHFREMEVVHLYWPDINFDLQTARVTSKPDLGFYPKRWEEREVPIPVKLIELLKSHRPRPGCKLVFPSPSGNLEYHMLDH